MRITCHSSRDDETLFKAYKCCIISLTDEVVRQQPKSPAAAAGGIDQSPSVKGVDSVRIQLKETSDQTKDSSNGPKPVKFEGIGPTDSETGVPIATRTVSIRFSNDLFPSDEIEEMRLLLEECAPTQTNY
jgi:hypothetical protein